MWISHLYVAWRKRPFASGVEFSRSYVIAGLTSALAGAAFAGLGYLFWEEYLENRALGVAAFTAALCAILQAAHFFSKRVCISVDGQRRRVTVARRTLWRTKVSEYEFSRAKLIIDWSVNPLLASGGCVLDRFRLSLVLPDQYFILADTALAMPRAVLEEEAREITDHTGLPHYTLNSAAITWSVPARSVYRRTCEAIAQECGERKAER